MKEENSVQNEKSQKEDQFVEVAVITTSGSYPSKGFEKTPAHQKVRVILKKAAEKLKITDTAGWIAVVGDKEIDPESTYIEIGLKGKVEIDYGPREGGGGNA